MSRLFDSYVMVDWSARSSPSPERPSADAIWIGTAGTAAAAPQYFRTRFAALGWLADFLADARAEGRRVLAGFDFPFGYPRGFAERLTGRNEALAVWAHLAAEVQDGTDNSNNRYAVAAAINARLGGAGPFWGRPRTADFPAILERKSDSALAGLPEFRLVEREASGAKSCWQLAYAGSVGSQVLVGLPALERLRHDPRLDGAARVWPFETGLAVSDAPILMVEIYPSLLSPTARPGEIKDAAQVRAASVAFADLDASERLVQFFEAPPGLSDEDRTLVAREEGWILGAGQPSFFRSLRPAASPPPLRDDCFALPPGVDWLPVSEALGRLRSGLAPAAGVEPVALAAAGGRILAEDLVAQRANPAAANAAVDGYGFAHASLGSGPQALPLLSGRAAAGAPFMGKVPAGSAVRILTGAVLPSGVDTIVLQEDVALDRARISFERGLRRGANTRALGEDVTSGALIFAAGRRLLPQDLALAAAVGIGDIPVRRRLRVAVLSTGDEIVTDGARAAPHQVYDANRPMLLDMLRRWDFEPIDLGGARDRSDAVAARLDQGAAEADAIIATGGASAGDEDHVAALLGARGSLSIWRIAVKPGRPLAMGFWRGVPVFGLPGNPVAAFVCALIFARPALGLLAGAGWEIARGHMLPAAFTKSKRPGRMEYLRARPDGAGSVEVFASEGSGRISGLAWARGLVELEPGPREIRPGDPVRYLPFAEFGL